MEYYSASETFGVYLELDLASKDIGIRLQTNLERC